MEGCRPWKMFENMALIIIDQTYEAALEVLKLDDGMLDEAAAAIVSLSAPVDPSDPDAPVFAVHASRNHCCVAFSTPHGSNAMFNMYTSPKGKSVMPDPGLKHGRISFSLSPGTLYLARTEGSKGHWDCTDVRPDVKSRGLLAILDTVMMRLDAAKKTLLGSTQTSRLVPGRDVEIIQVLGQLAKLRSELDLKDIMRRRQMKRRCVTEIVTAMDDDQGEETETLTKRLRTLCVGSSAS